MPQSLTKLYVHLIFGTKHRMKTFQEEYREFLERDNIGYDQQHVWD